MSYQLFEINGWNRNHGFRDSHFNLKLVDDLIRDSNYFLKHTDLLLATDYVDLDAFEEKVSWISSIALDVYLSSYFLEQNEIAF